ncbi:MAG: chemotaxis protein CheX [bacterium]|nr:chemotaxis protein CheX [bacterium]
MEKDLIAPFISAATEVIFEIMNEKAQTAPVVMVEKISNSQGMAVVVGFAGKLQGRLIIDVSPDTAHKVSELVLQEKVEKKDMELVESAIAEFGNVVAGRALTKLRNMGYEIKITPPTIFKGSNFQIMEKDIKMHIIPIDLNLGRIILNVSLKNGS